MNDSRKKNSRGKIWSRRRFLQTTALLTGGPATFSNFETGGQLTEIALAGVVVLRTQKTLAWNGGKMRAENAPEAGPYIVADCRAGWKK